MGCSAHKKSQVVIEPTLGNNEENIIQKLRDLSQRNLATDAEIALIRITYSNLKDINNERRGIWLQTIQNDILAPIYFSTVENFPFNNSRPFVPNEEILGKLQEKDYEALKRSKEDLRYCLLHVFCDFYNLFKIDILKLQRFFLAMCENYQDNPFHNFYHAFSVCQMIYTLSQKNNKFSKYLLPKDTFALMISAIGHDLNHPGVTNLFMINSRHELAITYNDQSVLENHHASSLIKFLELPGCDILSKTDCDPQQFRKTLIKTILATDMSLHNFVIEKFLSAIRNYDISNEDHRQSFSDIILHACDIGNPVLKFDLATVWSFKIIQEFNEQVWKEEKLGIPVTEYMRIGSDIQKIKRNQIGFIDMFIHPLWQVILPHLENVQDYLKTIEDNREAWEVLETLNIY
jgi:hypothetical protein